MEVLQQQFMLMIETPYFILLDCEKVDFFFKSDYYSWISCLANAIIHT